MEAVQIIRIEYYFQNGNAHSSHQDKYKDNSKRTLKKTPVHKVIAWKYKLIFNNDMSRASLTAMAGLIVIAIMVSNSAALQRIPKKC